MGRGSDGEQHDKYEFMVQEKRMKPKSISEASENGKPVSPIITADQKPNQEIQYLLLLNFHWKKSCKQKASRYEMF